MIDAKKLFKIYNLKTWKQNKFQIFLSILAISIAVAILISIRLIPSLTNIYKNINARGLNDGDINIVMTKPNITDEQINSLNKLKSEGKIIYATTYEMENNLTSGDIINEVELKFIDKEYYSINKNLDNYIEKLGNHNVLINRVTADKFNLKKGDHISLTIKGFYDTDTKFKVEDIIEKSNAIEENILGVIILDKSI
ncbi:MAG TPA: hypothetical protein VIK72_04405 [Clostridiaceae bacterium]